ncbi:MAG: hypothetical protein IJ567_09495 [Lachnospiraceae bacterium]|nr:hypothetical protein [Lachnospiraceae bacterium]
MKKIIKSKKAFCIILMPTILTLLSFLTERKFFSFSNLKPHEIITYIIVKIFLFIGLLLLSTFWCNIIINARQRIQRDRVYIGVFLILVLIYTIVLLCTWPGNWNNDEFLILNAAKVFDFQFHQSFITGIFFMMCLMLIPYAGGIIFVQEILCAMIAAYIISELVVCYGKKSLCLLMLFVSAPVIYFVLYPLRVCLWSFSLLLFSYFSKNVILDKRNVTGKQMILLATLAAIISTWRGEGKIIWIVSLLLFVLFYKGKLKYIFVFLSLGLVLLLGRINGLADTTTERTATIWSFMTGFSEMFSENDLYDPYWEEDYQNINSVLPIEGLTKQKSAWNLGLLQENVGQITFDDEEYSKFLKSSIRIIMFNPHKYIKAKWECFLASSGCLAEFVWVTPGADKEAILNILNIYQLDADLYNCVYPINESLQLKILYDLTGMYMFGRTSIPVYRIIWNSAVPIIFMVICTLLVLFRKEWRKACWTLLYWSNFGIVYLMQPTANVMYMFPFYLLGYALGVVLLLDVFSNRRKS